MIRLHSPVSLHYLKKDFRHRLARVLLSKGDQAGFSLPFIQLVIALLMHPFKDISSSA